MNKIRLNTIGEVVSKQSSSGEGLQIKSVAITENGTQAVTPDAGFGGLSKVVVNTDVNTQQGFDFSEIYDQKQTDELNNYYKTGVEYAKKIARDWDSSKNNITTIFMQNTSLVYFPMVDFSNVTNMTSAFNYATNLELFLCDTKNVNTMSRAFRACSALKQLVINAQNVTVITESFDLCLGLERLEIYDISKCDYFSGTFNRCSNIRTLLITKWKKGSISLIDMNLLSPESVHYIIQNAVDLADGATARTLTLQSIAKTNWQNSEYYQQDLAALSTKGITIA